MVRFAAVQMQKRFPITLLLGIALLFSQGGVLLVAALCPHLRLSAPICEAPEMKAGMDHSQMAHHDIDHSQVAHHDMDHDSSRLASASNAYEVTTAIGEREQSCSHCVIHLQSNSNLKVVRIADTGKRSSVDTSHGAVILPRIVPVGVAVLTPRDNGPPGKASRPKHLLINTFRI